MFEQILLAVDGSGRSREMMNMLLALPSLQRTQITVLHVIPVPASSEGLTEYRLAGERIVDKETKSLRLNSENRSVALLKEGDPKDIVCKVADELKPSLLIMGSRGMGRLQAILANSVSQYVFQLAAIPMLLIKDDVYIKTIRSVMVALDSSNSSKDSLDFAIKLIDGATDVEIFLSRVLKKNDDTTAESDPVLSEAIAKLKRMNIPYRTFLRAGDPGKEICKAAEESNASLLVLASPDRRPSIARSLPDLDRLLGTSVSDYVRVNASCPVLLTRPKEE
ncbi:universal stress protein [Tumidithrix elongata RA019]|uniref:Universal stress protein n=1 Tax=Tumidithrix elongata BACA0141 TaxID=2716417 RepID=A0AAW9PW37_9CYAN|nr:universal stress protein [Tumidithrix elongata RA019]